MTLEVFDTDLSKLLCCECREPFEVDELIVYLVDVSKETKEVRIPDTTGIVQRVAKPAHSIRLIHGSRPCYHKSKRRIQDSFNHMLTDTARNIQSMGKSKMERHPALFDSYQHYHRMVLEQDATIKIMPTMQQTHRSALLCYLFKVTLNPVHAFVIEDKTKWTEQQLSLFLQRFTEFRVTVELDSGINSKKVALEFQEELINPALFKNTKINHPCYVWADTAELTTHRLAVRYLVWQGPSARELHYLYSWFTKADSAVTYPELSTESSPCSEFHRSFLALNAELNTDTTALMNSVTRHPFPDTLTLHKPTLGCRTSKRLYFSSVDVVKAATEYENDAYSVRHNTQPTPESEEYFMLHWRQNASSSSSSSSSSESDMIPGLVQVRGHAMEPGIPVATTDRDSTVSDLAEDVSLRFVGSDDLRLVRLL